MHSNLRPKVKFIFPLLWRYRKLWGPNTSTRNLHQRLDKDRENIPSLYSVETVQVKISYCPLPAMSPQKHEAGKGHRSSPGALPLKLATVSLLCAWPTQVRSSAWQWGFETSVKLLNASLQTEMLLYYPEKATMWHGVIPAVHLLIFYLEVGSQPLKLLLLRPWLLPLLRLQPWTIIVTSPDYPPQLPNQNEIIVPANVLGKEERSTTMWMAISLSSSLLCWR